MFTRLPRPGELIVERRKIVDYLLCATHPDGVSKAKFFASLGFDAGHWQDLAAALVEHVT